MFTVSALSLLLRSVDAAQRGKATGLFHGGFLLGGIAGPALGGLVIGFSLRLPFFLYAGTLVVAGSLGLAMLRKPATGDDVTDERPERVGLRTALGNKAFRAAMVTNLADMWAVFGVRSALIPLFVIEGLDVGTIWIGVGLALVAGINGAVLFPAGMLADRIGRKPVMITGCVVGAAALMCLAVFDSLPGYLVAMVIFGIGSGMLDVTPAAVVGDVIGGGGGKPVAAFQMAGDFGTIVGPLVAGQLADVSSFGVAFAATGGVFLVAAAFAAAAPETLNRSATESKREVGKQVVDVLDADGQPHQIARDFER
jgi:MFS family permease